MAYGFTQWDADTGVFKAGQIRRASSSNDKVWGEVNSTNEVIDYGTFVSPYRLGGVQKINTVDDIIHGIVVRDIYVDGAPSDRQVNVGHFSHGDSVVAAAIEEHGLSRGDRVYVVIGGEDAGKVVNQNNYAGDKILTNFWVEEVSGNLVAITLGYFAGA